MRSASAARANRVQAPLRSIAGESAAVDHDTHQEAGELAQPNSEIRVKASARAASDSVPDGREIRQSMIDALNDILRDETL
jgi:hypothetical protein